MPTNTTFPEPVAIALNCGRFLLRQKYKVFYCFGIQRRLQPTVVFDRREPVVETKAPVAEPLQKTKDRAIGIIGIIAFEEKRRPTAPQKLFAALEHTQLMTLNITFDKGNAVQYIPFRKIVQSRHFHIKLLHS